jgi:hypothetical protein
MHYTKEQIDAAVDATSPECYIKHVTGMQYCDAVLVATQLSHDQDGVLTEADKEFITSLMP